MAKSSPVNSSANSQVNSPANAQTDRDWSYETAIARVETLVKQIETGDLDLADVFDRFDAASRDLQHCERFLAEKQQQLDLAIETLESTPNPAIEPL